MQIDIFLYGKLPKCVQCLGNILNDRCKLGLSQCDQMAKLCFQYLAINSNENLSNITNLSNYGDNFSPIKIKPSKNSQRLKVLPKWRNLAKFGHTGAKRAKRNDIIRCKGGDEKVKAWRRSSEG